MDTIARYHTIVEQVLTKYLEIEYANGEIHNEPIFDRTAGRYVVISSGWQGVRRVHGCLIHINIQHGKVWIQRDSTEHGIAHDLMATGMPRDHIVLGFYTPSARRHIDFAPT